MADGTSNPVPDTKVLDTQEFFEDASQGNALNLKRTIEEYQDLALTSARRSQINFDNLQQISLSALKASVDLQVQLNAKTLADIENSKIELAHVRAQRARHADSWNYETAYDLGNPVSTGAGDALRSAAYTPNRAVDTATAGVAATVPASSDVRIIETVGQLVTQVAGLAALIQQMVAANKPAAATS